MKKLGFLLLFVLLAAINLQATHANKLDTTTLSTDSSLQTTVEDKHEALLMEKLSPEQLYELEKYRSAADHNDDGPTPAGIVLISLMPFATAILIIFLVLRNKRLKEQRMFQLYEKALDAGKELPESFFNQSNNEQKSHLLKGMIWMGSGLGISIGALYLMGKDSPWGFGLIPFFVGIAYLISYFIEKPDKAKESHND